MTPESGFADYPTERRVQWLALASLAGVVALDAALVGFGPARILGLTVPGAVSLGLMAAGLVAGIVAVMKRNLWFAAAALLALGLPALAERPWVVTPLRFAGSVGFGFLALMFAELVHMTQRYEKWHHVADAAGLTSDRLDQATTEYLGTFTKVFGLSALIAAVIGGVYFTLMNFGPAQHRAALDYSSLYGLVGAAVLVFGALLVFALARGADWSKPDLGSLKTATGPDPEATTIGSPEVDSHAKD